MRPPEVDRSQLVAVHQYRALSRSPQAAELQPALHSPQEEDRIRPGYPEVGRTLLEEDRIRPREGERRSLAAGEGRRSLAAEAHGRLAAVAERHKPAASRPGAGTHPLRQPWCRPAD